MNSFVCVCVHARVCKENGCQKCKERMKTVRDQTKPRVCSARVVCVEDGRGADDLVVH